MGKYTKEYSIEWSGECEADSFEEAKKILDIQAEKENDTVFDLIHGEITKEEDD